MEGEPSFLEVFAITCIFVIILALMFLTPTLVFLALYLLGIIKLNIVTGIIYGITQLAWGILWTWIITKETK